MEHDSGLARPYRAAAITRGDHLRASQRADLLSRAGVAVDWRAVEHDRKLPVTGSRSDSDQATWDRELAEVTSLARPANMYRTGPRS